MTSNSGESRNAIDYEVFYIGNIPSQFHSADLRAFFSQLVEDNGFKCFHFRHRPEKQGKKVESSGKVDSSTSENKDANQIHAADNVNAGSSDNLQPNSTCCCVVKVLKDKLTLFEPYAKSQWCDKKGVYYPKRVLIANLNDIKSIHHQNDTQSQDDQLYLSKREKKERASMQKELELTLSDIDNLIEMDPPPLMPQGNVGTSLKHFMTLIKKCQLPTSIIKKLDLKFPKSFSKRKFGSVPHDYTDGNNDDDDDDDKTGSYESNSEPEEDGNVDIRDEHGDAEDWERHETLHNDVGTQARTKERLFEEDLEVKWEKGGSGLVFYTDSYFWHELKGKDFDEDTVDDWDVDMGIYYGEGAGDFDSEQLHDMRMEKKMRQDGIDRRVGFEKFSKGFGSGQLYKHGWQGGKGVGSWIEGISEPIEATGQHPRDKTGLGFHQKRKRNIKAKKRKEDDDVYIATVYDKPITKNSDDDDDSLLERSNGPHDITYKRRLMTFVQATKSK